MAEFFLETGVPKGHAKLILDKQATVKNLKKEFAQQKMIEQPASGERRWYDTRSWSTSASRTTRFHRRGRSTDGPNERGRHVDFARHSTFAGCVV